MDAYTLRERAWFHVELGNFDTADLLIRRAFEIDHAPVEVADGSVIL